MNTNEAKEKADAMVSQLEPVMGFAVTDARSFQQAGELLQVVSTMRKEAVAWRQDVVGPIKKGIRAFESKILPGIKRCEAAEKHLRAEIGEYKRKELEAANEAAEAAEAAMEAGDTEAAVELATQSTEVTESDSVSTYLVYSLEVVDFAALPDEYKLPDMSKLRKAANTVHESGEPIPGTKLVTQIRTRVK